jgi:putative heme-binding domain-containing protein
MDDLAALFGDPRILAGKRKILADTVSPLPIRKAAMALLARMDDAEAIPVFQSLLDDPKFRRDVLPLLARSSDPATAAAILQRYPQLSPDERSTALTTLTSRTPFALALVSAMARGTFPKTDLTALHLRQMQQLGSAELNDALGRTWGRFNPTSDSARATVSRFSRLFHEAPLWAYDADKGREVFQKACASCHAHGGGEPKIGPDLGGSWRHGADYFLENIADPNAVIGDAFQLTIITRHDGSISAGALEKESPEAITLRTITESLAIPASQIKSREKLPQSLMPAGLLDALSEREVIELLKFLTSPR